MGINNKLLKDSNLDNHLHNQIYIIKIIILLPLNKKFSKQEIAIYFNNKISKHKRDFKAQIKKSFFIINILKI